ncbi:hypothetical protein GP486_005838 [Trichoglossum hirsutum]|uniref:Uncharacterized protein n=1 Tax=Trichoglossum hirsutum TaxID=265104 RepID=A0A9P8RLI5_9PEZI|nr:hypothetical protein GP486_005838 [Trichoglossum hirsutum]
MDRKSIEIVVAHYNEDLRWMAGVAEDCIVYSKGTDTGSVPLPHIVLPNIGREGHTYLHHITTRYDELADITIFAQGSIGDHINLNIVQMKNAASKMSTDSIMTFPPRDLELFDAWEGIEWERYPCWRKWSSMVTKRMPLTPAEYFARFIGGGRVPVSIGFQPGAIFAVPRQIIHSRPLGLYKELMQTMFLGDMAHFNPETGHYMERFWLAMWKPDEYICWSREDVSKTDRNREGQLTKGRWRVVPAVHRDHVGSIPEAGAKEAINQQDKRPQASFVGVIRARLN